MKPGFWETATNLFLLVLWFRIWTHDDRGLIFNRYLLPLGRLADKVAGFLNPIFFGLSDRVILAVTLIFLICFRAMFMTPGEPWTIILGPETYACETNRILSCILFSAASFGMLLFRLWGLSLVYVGYEPTRGHAGEAAYCMTRPFSDIRHGQRPFVLLAVGLLMITVLRAASGTGPDGVSVTRHALRALVAVLAEWVNLLPAIGALLFLMIIGSWVGTFMGAGGISVLCRDWMDLLLGPLRNKRIRLGMIDFTAWVVLFALNYLHVILYGILAQLHKVI